MTRYLAFLILCASVRAEATQYWVYKSANLLVPEQVEATAQLLKRAGAVGYTHCLLTDSKFSRLKEMPERYFANVAKIKAMALESHIELVPALFSIGYSNDLLSRDPNLAEGMPVRDCPFVVKQGQAVLMADPTLRIKGGDFTDGAKGWGWKDDTINVSDGVATSREPNGKNARISQTLQLQPWRQYHITVRVRSKAYQGTPEVKLINADGLTLNFDYLKMAPTQDWKVHHIVFNSQANPKVNLYLGCWDGRSGEMSWDDVTIEECPFVNLIRREQAPLQVKTADGRLLVEGKDYEPLHDPLLGTQPYAGCFTIYHEPPVLRTKLPDGTKLLISYYHAVTVHDDQANICVSEPKTLDILRDQATRVHAAFGAKGYFMSHDEIRVFNWSELPDGKMLTAGQLLAENVRACTGILRKVNPQGKIYVWGDMFDPNHNAHDKYYLANGDYAGSWEGLDQEVTVVPWAFELRNKSIPFHAGRGHHQILAGYYDQPDKLNAKEWLEAGAKSPNVDGIMFTTWKNDYSKLEAFIQQAKQR